VSPPPPAAATAALASPSQGAEPPAEGCRGLPRSPAPAGASVVLVLNDTMRRDRMGIHGGPARTPNFDAFAREHLWFERAVAQAPWTKPSVATLFTSLYPSQHGVVTHPSHQMEAGEALGRSLLASDRLPDAAATLAEAYRAAGFRTAAFVANPWMDRRFGFEQGFEVYDDSFARWDVPGEQVVAAALAWLAKLDPGERYFLYVHTIDTHRPYPALTWEEVEAALEQPAPPGELPLKARREIMSLIRIEGPRPPGVRPPAKRRVLKRAYDKGIERWDEAFGQLLAGLARDPRYDRTAILVTSDHGEALYRRGYGNHGLSLYQADLAVPMAARLPGAEATRVDCRVGLIDVMPTLCEWSGLACPDGMTGRSFFAASEGEPGAEDGLYLGEAALTDLDQRAAYRGRYKLIHSPGPRAEANPPPRPWSFYDLGADPSEERDLLGEHARPEAVEQAFAALRLALDEAAAGGPVLDREDAPVDRELEQRLRSLGYVE
jgi:arylsulfatase A-like enzyme